MFLWLKHCTVKRAVTWPFNFYTIIWTLSIRMLYTKYTYIEEALLSKDEEKEI